MTSAAQPKVFGVGMIALDLVMGLDPQQPIRSWAGGTCGNVLSILAYLGWDAFPIARMNGDAASDRVRADLGQWGVHLDFASCGPTADTPIVIQEIRRGRDGKPKHRFSWSCPQCGHWLPGFKPVTKEVVEVVQSALTGTAVFFLDRLSRSTLTLAKQASDRGAVVIFEPSGKANDPMFSEALRISHILKYSEQRLGGIENLTDNNPSILVEIQTLGEKGLKYRHRLGRGLSNWLHLDAVKAPKMADSCGSGDWCTAGLISKIATHGQDDLRKTGPKDLRAALRFGQALAAWNCGFEGARGGMYAITREVFDTQVAAIMSGREAEFAESPMGHGPEASIPCPSCYLLG
jgi:sugar/nucleoside kinase (ribokinase family)